MTFFQKIIFFLMLSLTLSSVGFLSDTRAAEDPKSTKYGLDTVASAAELNKKSDVPVIIGGIVGTGLSLVTVIFFILIIYGGIVWMTAHGDESKTQKSRQILLAAGIGMIMILSAYIITTFIFGAIQKGSPGGGSGGASGPEKTDKFCTEKGGECQDNATAGSLCTIGNENGIYEPGLCKSKSSPTYLCCFLTPKTTP